MRDPLRKWQRRGGDEGRKRKRRDIDEFNKVSTKKSAQGKSGGGIEDKCNMIIGENPDPIRRNKTHKAGGLELVGTPNG